MEADQCKETEKQPLSKPLSYSCDFPSCDRHELTEITCHECGKNHCLAHRHAADHSCPSVSKVQEKAVESKEKRPLWDITEDMKRRKPVKPENQAMADKLMVMKLKMKATGELAKIPHSERVFLAVNLPQGVDMAFVVSKEWSVGKCVDSMATHAI